MKYIATDEEASSSAGIDVLQLNSCHTQGLQSSSQTSFVSSVFYCSSSIPISPDSHFKEKDLLSLITVDNRFTFNLSSNVSDDSLAGLKLSTRSSVVLSSSAD